MADDSFGRTADGQSVPRHVLSRGDLRVEIIAFGAVITAIEVPDREGRVANVVLGEHSSLLHPFRYERFATGDLHPVSHSPYPWS